MREQRAHVFDQRRDVRRAHLQALDTAECEQLGRQPRPALGSRKRVFRIALELRLLGALGDYVEPANDDCQQVVEVVRDSARQLAERLHLLALAKLLLRGLEVGDVARLEQQIDDPSVRALHRLNRYLEMGGWGSLAFHPNFLLEQLSVRRLLHCPLHQNHVLRYICKVGASQILNSTASRGLE